MTSPLIPPAAVRRLGVPQLRPLARYQWEASRLSLTALTGQPWTLVRASTATLTDSAGTTVTVGHTMPRYEARSYSGVPAIGLRVSTEDLTTTWDVLPSSSTWLVELIDLGTAGTPNAGLLYVGRDDQTGARLAITGGSNTYTATFTNPGGLTSVATFGATVSNGDAVQLVVQLDDDGTNQRVRIGGSDAGLAVAFSAWGTARARAAAWGTGARVRLNRLGSAGTQGSAWVRRVAEYPGLLTLADALARL